ncbi:MAG: DUF169 domain-containing protein [Deltaproteobacteria bacterium]|nr:DUF169 domain-containing protein [Deltaproteobacteria bacterium]MBW1952390.1 DUF169 domain-containing protein [Deltaproteobacteria bacterium]MBW1985901.1 DUF169 domain-containing protein [Deltaproteobacteria bacterium]MBW2133661.1 DUF169 domain-containing protein [Deltaproteobacteria bacterium]
MDYNAATLQLKEDLRLRTEPLGVNFLKSPAELPDKTRRPSKVFKKKVTICQGLTMARVYGWSVGLTKDDLICIPAMLAFGLTPAAEPATELGQLFCEVGFHPEAGPGIREAQALPRLAPGELGALYMSPLDRLKMDPEIVVIYGNPAQLIRLIGAATFSFRERVNGSFGGKVECAEYLIGPYQSQQMRVAIPGMGDRIFSMTQDDEMVMAFPIQLLEGLLVGLKEAGRKIGARYPITFYQNFQPEFPKPYQELAKKLGMAGE